MIKKILLTLLTVVLVLAAIIVLFIGPWPTYASSYEGKAYYTDAIEAINESAGRSTITASPGAFKAGWSSHIITPPIGTPLAGYGGRHGKPSTGVIDELHVKALAVSDGPDTAVIVGSDMLIVPDNIADLVREGVLAQTSLRADSILFNASHTHAGPGAWAPGILGKQFAGTYDPEIVNFLAGRFIEAIVEAVDRLEPAKLASGSVDVPELIRNRTRSGNPVDSELSYLVVEQADGDRCFLVSYSAHPTILSDDNMEFTAEFPGYLMARIAEVTDAEAIYLGGALGSMGHNAPQASTPLERVKAMGRELANKVLESAQDLTFDDTIDVGAAGVNLELPPFQLRLTPNWRLSKFIFPIVFKMDTDAWIGGVRLDNIVLVGASADYCGEISKELKQWAEGLGLDLWVLSFAGDYAGYISPDQYYNDLDPKEGLGYERGLMSWTGPHQEAWSASLIKQMAQQLTPES